MRRCVGRQKSPKQIPTETPTVNGEPRHLALFFGKPRPKTVHAWRAVLSHEVCERIGSVVLCEDDLVKLPLHMQALGKVQNLMLASVFKTPGEPDKWFAGVACGGRKSASSETFTVFGFSDDSVYSVHSFFAHCALTNVLLAGGISDRGHTAHRVVPHPGRRAFGR